MFICHFKQKEKADGETLINLSLNAYISIESSGEITKLDLFNSS